MSYRKEFVKDLLFVTFIQELWYYFEGNKLNIEEIYRWIDIISFFILLKNVALYLFELILDLLRLGNLILRREIVLHILAVHLMLGLDVVL